MTNTPRMLTSVLESCLNLKKHSNGSKVTTITSKALNFKSYSALLRPAPPYSVLLSPDNLFT